MADDKYRRIFEEERGGLAFRELFTPNREGPLGRWPSKPHPPGKGGPSVNPKGILPVVTSVWSASDAAANAMTLSNGGLTVTPSGAASYTVIRNSIGKTSGKLYVEFANSLACTTDNMGVGLSNAGINISTYLGGSANGFGAYPANLSYGVGFVTSSGISGGNPAANDVWALAVDFGAGLAWVAKNNVWQSSGSPSAGTTPAATFTPATVGALFASMVFNGAGEGVWTLQPTAASQKYLPPPGFQAWDGGPITPPASSVWSASDAAANAMTLSNGGLTVAGSGTGNWGTVRGSIGQSSGKVYIEFSVTGTISADSRMFGLANAGFSSAVGNYLGSSNNSVGNQPVSGTYYVTTGFTVTPAGAGFAGVTLAVNDVLSIAVDFTGQDIWFAHNNVWFTGNPSTATLPFATFVAATVGALFPSMSLISTGPGVWTLQPTAASQKYAPPAGFSAWDAPPPTGSVWSASDAAANGMTLSNGGLTVTPGGAAGTWHSIRGSTGKSSGKLYVEFNATTTPTGAAIMLGLANAGFNSVDYLGNNPNSAGMLAHYTVNYVSAGFTSNYIMPFHDYGLNDVAALAIDFTTGNIWAAVNNVWVNSSNPATGSLPILSFVLATTGALFPAMAFNDGAIDGTWTLQPTAASQKYAPPSGFTPWG